MFLYLLLFFKTYLSYSSIGYFSSLTHQHLTNISSIHATGGLVLLLLLVKRNLVFFHTWEKTVISLATYWLTESEEVRYLHTLTIEDHWESVGHWSYWFVSYQRVHGLFVQHIDEDRCKRILYPKLTREQITNKKSQVVNYCLLILDGQC